MGSDQTTSACQIKPHTNSNPLSTPKQLKSTRFSCQRKLSVVRYSWQSQYVLLSLNSRLILSVPGPTYPTPLGLNTIVYISQLTGTPHVSGSYFTHHPLLSRVDFSIALWTFIPLLSYGDHTALFRASLLSSPSVYISLWEGSRNFQVFRFTSPVS